MKSVLKIMVCSALMLTATCVTYAQEEAPVEQRIEKATTWPSLECYAPGYTVQLVCNDCYSFDVLITTQETPKPSDNGFAIPAPAVMPERVGMAAISNKRTVNAYKAPPTGQARSTC